MRLIFDSNQSCLAIKLLRTYLNTKYNDTTLSKKPLNAIEKASNKIVYLSVTMCMQ